MSPELELLLPATPGQVRLDAAALTQHWSRWRPAVRTVLKLSGAEIDERRRREEISKRRHAFLRRRWNSRNRAKIAAGQRAYREANRAKIAAGQRAYREANRAKIAAGQRAEPLQREQRP